MSGIQTGSCSCDNVELLAAVPVCSTTGYKVISEKLGILGYPFVNSRIITLLNSCGKLLLAWLPIKGKSEVGRKEVAVIAPLKFSDPTTEKKKKIDVKRPHKTANIVLE